MYFPAVWRPTRRVPLLRDDVIALVMINGTEEEEDALILGMKSLYDRVSKRLFVCTMGGGGGDSRFFHLWPGDIAMHAISSSNSINEEHSMQECQVALQRYVATKEASWIALLKSPFWMVESVYIASSPPPLIEADIYHVEVDSWADNTMTTSILPFLVRSSVFFSQCTFKGWIHPLLQCKNTSHHERYHEVSFVDHDQRKASEARISSLRSWANAVSQDQKERARALYHLARALQNNTKAYDEHNEIQPFSNYLYDARYRIARIKLASCGNTSTYEEVLKAFLSAHEQHDGYFRKEPLYYAAWLSRTHGFYHRCVLYGTAAIHTPPLDPKRLPLFVETYMYRDDSRVIREEVDFCISKIKSAL